MCWWVLGPIPHPRVQPPALLQTKHVYPTSKLRPKHCDQPIPGITAGVGEQQGQICMIHTWARSRYLTHLPNPPRVLETQKGRDDVDDMLGWPGADAQAADDESSDSEGSVGPPTMGSDQESAEMMQLLCQPHTEARSGLMLGGGVGEWKH